MRNTVFICLVLSTTSEALVTTGFATFLPKFIEHQFGMTSSFAATLGGKSLSLLLPDMLILLKRGVFLGRVDHFG